MIGDYSDSARIKGDRVDFTRESRKRIRYPLQVPTTFWWKEKTGFQREGEGVSRDLSDIGAFVFADSSPPAGVDVKLSLPLPPLPNGNRPVRMEMEGRVVRVEQAPSNKGGGFAVSSKSATLRENGEIVNHHS